MTEEAAGTPQQEEQPNIFERRLEHDKNGALTPIIGWSDMLRERGVPGDDVVYAAEQIAEAARRLGEVGQLRMRYDALGQQFNITHPSAPLDDHEAQLVLVQDGIKQLAQMPLDDDEHVATQPGLAPTPERLPAADDVSEQQDS